MFVAKGAEDGFDLWLTDGRMITNVERDDGKQSFQFIDSNRIERTSIIIIRSRGSLSDPAWPPQSSLTAKFDDTVVVAKEHACPHLVTFLRATLVYAKKTPH
jgi:hypothetical protein